MIEPLALLLCKRGLIATPLTQRLEGLRYRVKTLSQPAELTACAAREQAMVIIADFEGARETVLPILVELRADVSTRHIPVIGFMREVSDADQVAWLEAGATAVVNESAVLNHLPQLLDRALEL